MDLIDKLLTLENDASDFGCQWENTAQIMEQIQSECAEVNEHLTDLTNINTKDLQEEIGDLLHAVFSLAIFCHFDAKETLELSLAKFERRLRSVKAIAQEKGLVNLKDHSFEELMVIWRQAKERAG